MSPRHLLARASFAAAALVCAPSAFAQKQAAPARESTSGREGTVIAIDSGDLVVDLGLTKGAREGVVVEVWRPVKLRHPVTGQTLVDRFRIGNVTLSQVQPNLALARVDSGMMRPPATGDVVVLPELESAPSATKPVAVAPAPLPPAGKGATTSPSSKPVAPAAPAASTAVAAGGSRGYEGAVVLSDPDAKALGDLFDAIKGWTPEARAKAYEAFMRKNPRSRFNVALAEEIVALQGAAARPQAAPRAYESSFEPFNRLRPGVPQRFAVELDPRFVGGIVHVKRKNETGYRSLVMEPVGERYWAATLPGDSVDEAGMQYFVEGVLPKGPALPVIGTSTEPRDADVEQRPLFGKKHGTLAQFSVQSELASFNAKRQNDYLFQTEGTFGWRIQDVGVRAIRSGFGVFRGKGGELAALEAGSAGQDVGLTYGHIEGEFGITPIFSVVTRPILGLRKGGVSGGAQGFLRIGNDLKTNLMVGGEVLGSVGLRGVVQLDWRSFKRVPVLLRSEVTNQPAGLDGDVGVRAIAQGGYEFVPDLVVAARVSYQGRTINHAGPGAGLGVSYQW